MFAVLGVAGATVLAAGVASAVNPASQSALTGCIKAGTIRVLDAHETCKDNEAQVTFLTGPEVTSAMIADGTITDADLSESLLETLTSGTSEVAWDQLVDIPADLADGDDDGSALVAALAAELANADGTDSSVNESTDPVSWFRLNSMPDGFADGTDDVDGGTAGDLDCSACLDAGHLGSGAVGAGELQDGAVGTNKQQANVAMSLPGASSLQLDSGNNVEAEDSPVITIMTPPGTGSAAHTVMLTGQFQATCTCGGNGEVVSVEWQIVDQAGQGIGPVYSDELTQFDQTIAGSTTALDNTAEEGAGQTYQLRVRASAPALTATTTVNISNAVLTATDLGRG